MGLKWLITGGCGFLGTSLIECLKKESGHYIRVIDNLSVGSRDDLGAVSEFHEIEDVNQSWEEHSVQLYVGDILDEKIADLITVGADIIVHFAANTGVGPSVENPRMDCVTNVIGTFNYLDSARKNKVKRFVFASSGAPAGEVEPPIHEELPPHPVSPYGASKLAGEGYCSAYYRTFGLETVALRFGNVYGPGSAHKSSVVAKFIKNCIQFDPMKIYGNGNQTRDFIYIDDLIDAVIKASTVAGVGGETFQIATNAETSVQDMLKILLKIFQDMDIKTPAVVYEEARLGDVMRNYSDTSKARNLLGWSAKYNLATGLKDTVSWFLKNYQAK